MSLKLEAGQWYRTRNGNNVRCLGWSDSREGCFVVEAHNAPYYVFIDGRHLRNNHHWDIIEHLPGCTGFDWEPPKPIEPPEGWRLLNDGEKILATDKYWDGQRWIDLDQNCVTVGDMRNHVDHRKTARKIEPKYRQFANADEFKRHRDKWWKWKGDKSTNPPAAYNDRAFGCNTYSFMFANAEFDDGTPFGVRIDE